MNSKVMFFVFAGIILIFSVMTVVSRRILRSAVYLLFVLLATAGLYFMLNFNFLAAVQLTVYAGGIVVLIIFSILLTSHISERAPMAGARRSLFSALAVIIGAILTLTTIFRFTFVPSSEPAIGSDIKTIGTKLISYGEGGYALPFEVISVLLLAAMIGAIIVARKETK
ncbi:MAG: NADH-quinone oxidoreductase subunit J [Bacteroidetes bacterium]|nr:NADH-quinone oxidoreductase subunit J [Bacteroidota bacterium]